jgi:hypothetical protein
VGELRWIRGNKVFQVVTPARQGSPGLFAVSALNESHFYLIHSTIMLFENVDKSVLHGGNSASRAFAEKEREGGGVRCVSHP